MFQHKSLAEKKARKLNSMLFCHQIAIYRSRRIRFLPRKSTNMHLIPVDHHQKSIKRSQWRYYTTLHYTTNLTISLISHYWHVKIFVFEQQKKCSSIHKVFHHFWTEWMKYFQAKCKWLTFFLFPTNLRGILNELMWTNQRFWSGTV